MSDETVVTRMPGVVLDAQGNPIAPPVDDGVKAEITKALEDPFIRKLISVQVTGYQMYAAARDLMERTEYSVAVKQGLLAALFHELFDPVTKLCRPFDFGVMRQRLRDTVVPFTSVMAGKFRAMQEQTKQLMLEADRKLRETPMPFFKDVGELERGEIYVFHVAPENVGKAMELIAAWMAKLGAGSAWLSKHGGNSEEYKALQQMSGDDINVVPVEAIRSVFTTRRTTLLNLPLMHVFFTDAPEQVLVGMGDGKALERFHEGLQEKKAIAIVVMAVGQEWPSTLGRRGALFVNAADTSLEEAMTAQFVPQLHRETPA